MANPAPTALPEFNSFCMSEQVTHTCPTDKCSGTGFSAQVLYVNFRKHCGRSFNGFTTPRTTGNPPPVPPSSSGVVSSKYI